jgi:hypothetical protein
VNRSYTGRRPPSRTSHTIARARVRSDTRCGGGFRHRNRTGTCRPAVQRLLHNEARGNGHGTIDLPLDRRSPRWPTVGLPARSEMVTTLIAQLSDLLAPQYPNLRRARSRPVPTGLCAVSRWCEGCRNKGKAQLRPALDRISERITLAFQTLSRPEQSGGHHRKTRIYLIFQHDGGESVSQSPLKDQAFSPFLDQNPPFELPPENGISPSTKACPVQWTVIDNSATKRLAKGKLPSHRSA